MRLSDEEKTALREAAQLPTEDFAPRKIPAPLSTEAYFRQLEEWAKLIPPSEKPVAFEGDTWRL